MIRIEITDIKPTPAIPGSPASVVVEVTNMGDTGVYVWINPRILEFPFTVDPGWLWLDGSATPTQWQKRYWTIIFTMPNQNVDFSVAAGYFDGVISEWVWGEGTIVHLEPLEQLFTLPADGTWS